MNKTYLGVGIALIVLIAGVYFVLSQPTKPTDTATTSPSTTPTITEIKPNNTDEFSTTSIEANVLIDEDGWVVFYDDRARLKRSVSFKRPVEWYVVDERVDVTDTSALVYFYDVDYTEVSMDRHLRGDHVFYYSKNTWETMESILPLYLGPETIYQKPITIDGKVGYLVHIVHPDPELVAIAPDSGWYAIFEEFGHTEDNSNLPRQRIYKFHIRDDYPNAEEELTKIVESIVWSETAEN